MDPGKDLAYIHDAGFLSSPRKLGPLVVSLLADRGLERGHIVSVTGSGRDGAGAHRGEASRCWGSTHSHAMVELARRGARHRLPRRLVGGRQAPSVRRRDRDRRGAGLRRLHARPKNELVDLFGPVRHIAARRARLRPRCPGARAGRRAVRLPGRRRGRRSGHRVGRPAPAAHHRVPPDRGRGDGRRTEEIHLAFGPFARSTSCSATPTPASGPPRLWQRRLRPGPPGLHRAGCRGRIRSMLAAMPVIVR